MPLSITYRMNSDQYIMVGKAKISIKRLRGVEALRVTIDAPQDIKIENHKSSRASEILEGS